MEQEEVWTIVEGIGSSSQQAEILTCIAPYLPEHLLKTIWKVAIESPRYLIGLAPYLSEALLSEAISAAREIEHDYTRFDVVAELAIHLARTGQITQALDELERVKYDNDRLHAMAAIASYAPEEQRADLIGHVMNSLRNMEPIERYNTLNDVIPSLPVSALREAAKMAQKSEGTDETWDRLWALASIALHLAKQGLFEEALTLTEDINDDREQARALVTLVPYLPAEQQHEILQQALPGARQIDAQQYPHYHTHAEIAVHLARIGRIEQALTIAAELDTERDYHDMVLSWIAESLIQRGRDADALTIIRNLIDKGRRADGLIALAAVIAPSSKMEAYHLWCEALQEFAGMPRRNFRWEPVLSVGHMLGGDNLAEEALQVLQDVVRWWP